MSRFFLLYLLISDLSCNVETTTTIEGSLALRPSSAEVPREPWTTWSFRWGGHHDQRRMIQIYGTREGVDVSVTTRGGCDHLIRLSVTQSPYRTYEQDTTVKHCKTEVLQSVSCEDISKKHKWGKGTDRRKQSLVKEPTCLPQYVNVIKGRLKRHLAQARAHSWHTEKWDFNQRISLHFNTR